MMSSGNHPPPLSVPCAAMEPSHGPHPGQKSGSSRKQTRVLMGVSFRREVSSCAVPAIGKNTQQPHPKQFNLGVTVPFSACEYRPRGSILSTVMGGSKCVSNITDKLTKYNEICCRYISSKPRGKPSVLCFTYSGQWRPQGF